MKRHPHNIKTIRWAGALVLLCIGVCAGRVAIRLDRQVDLEAGPVTLESIATITGASAEEHERLATLIVAEFEPATAQAAVGPFEITRALARAGIAPAQIDLYGASTCRIEFNATELPDVDESAVDTPDTPALADFWSVSDELTATLARLRGVEPARVIVEWQCNDPDLLASPLDRDRFKFKPLSPAMLGLVRFEIIDHSTEPGSRIRVHGRAEQLCEVVTALREIVPGERIGPRDVRLSPMRISSTRDLGFTRLEAVVGQEAARTIRANEIIAEGKVRKLQLVKRGEPVTIHSRIGSVHITARGEARGDAGMGEEVPVCRSNERSIVFGVVTGAGEVTLGQGPAEPEATARLAEATREYAHSQREEQN